MKTDLLDFRVKRLEHERLQKSSKKLSLTGKRCFTATATTFKILIFQALMQNQY